ncbi:hypothetical protein [Neobacillus sp. Marseille-QA0830]
MTEKEAQQLKEFFANLKKAGFMVEQKVNQQIQELLNKKELVQLADIHSEWMGHNLKALHETMETLAALLHLPTKNDIANAAKLIIQTEDKVDQLEEHFHKLHDLVKKLVDKHHLCQDVKQDASDPKEDPADAKTDILDELMEKNIEIIAKCLSKKMKKAKAKKRHKKNHG